MNWFVNNLTTTNNLSHSQQSGLHSELVEIDHKLHAIVAGRKRNMLQTIQEETATNIYYPSPVQDLIGPDLNNTTSTGARNSNIIWITGEFFGVQRARDMLVQVSVNKVRVRIYAICMLN
jgi:hypothetical protein